MGDDAVALIRYIEWLRTVFNGSVISTTGVKSSDHRGPKSTTDFDFYAYILLDFELDSDGTVRPTSSALREKAEIEMRRAFGGRPE